MRTGGGRGRCEGLEADRFYSQVVELERQLLLGLLLVPFDQQTQELGFEDALKDAVILLLVDDEDVVLQSAARDRR